MLGLRSAAVNPAVGLSEGVVLLVLYELATTLLALYGSRGIVLTMFAGVVLAGAGLLATRGALHTAVDTAPEVGHVEHRLHGAVVAALIAVVVIIAAGITAAVVFSGKSTSPKPPTPVGLSPPPTRSPPPPRTGQAVATRSAASYWHPPHRWRQAGLGQSRQRGHPDRGVRLDSQRPGSE